MQVAIITLFFECVFTIIAAMLLCLLPVRKNRRKSRAFVYSFGLCLCVLQTLLTAFFTVNFGIGTNVTLLIGMIPIFIYYVACHKVSVPILLFIFLTAMLSVAFVTGFTNGAYYYFFPNEEQQHIVKYISVQLCVAAVFISIFYFAFTRHLPKIIDTYTDKKVWKKLWIIPLTLTAILVVFPQNSGQNALSYFIVSLFLYIGSLLIYYMLCLMMAQSILASKLLLENNEKEKQLIIEQSQYNVLFSGIEQARIASHDFRHHLQAITAYCKDGENDKLLAYIEQYSTSLSSESVTVFCDNPMLNKLLSYYFALANENGISVDFKAAMPDKIAISEPDLWVLFGNCIENAIEACNRQNSVEKFIKLRIKLKGGILGIALDNSYEGDINKSDSGVFMSSKNANRTGVGLVSVQTVVEKYHGALRTEYDGRLFCVSVALSLG